MALKIGG